MEQEEHIADTWHGCHPKPVFSSFDSFTCVLWCVRPIGSQRVQKCTVKSGSTYVIPWEIMAPPFFKHVLIISHGKRASECLIWNSKTNEQRHTHWQPPAVHRCPRGLRRSKPCGYPRGPRESQCHESHAPMRRSNTPNRCITGAPRNITLIGLHVVLSTNSG